MSSRYNAGVLQPASKATINRVARADKRVRWGLKTQRGTWAPDGNRGDADLAAWTDPRKNLTRIKTTQL